VSRDGELPVGTVTFLFTDIEGSTQLLKRLGGDRYGEALAEHQRILRDVFAEQGGREIDTQGDSFFIAFRRAKDAVAAAIACQRLLAEHAWPEGTELRVRMGIHTGEPVVGSERYVGLGVHRAARISSAGHGGQVLVSQATRELLRDDPLQDASLRDLGEHQLKDMDGPERIFQLLAPGLEEDFPALNAAAPTLLRERYEPLEVVGRGGEAEVIRAVDHLHGRQVALKVRPAADEASRTQLLSEARLLLSLSPHPGLPLVREDFFVDRRYVIALDWIEGRDLEALLDGEGRSGLDPELAIAYLRQAAEALEHLHTHDPPVVHGDVKPANLILTSSGRIVLVDFGVSSIPTDDLRRAGTAGYVAPEVAGGARPTAAADVYSFAATAHALLTGEPPSSGALSWGAIEDGRIPALERIVRSNLATDPARRDSSAAAFVARLERWMGTALPSGAVTLVLADLSAIPPRTAEDSVDEVARAHGGHCISPVDDGPLLVAFGSAQEGVEAARELVGRFGARMAAATGDEVPHAGGYRGEVASTAAELLKLADPGQVLVDDGTARALGDRLPPALGLAELSEGLAATEHRAWVLVAPGLAAPPRAHACPYRGLMSFQPEDGDLYFGREEVVATTVDRILAEGFMAVVGASGSGKSSLVRAGIIPAFRRAREGSIVVMTPGSDPEIELGRSMGDDPPALVVVDQLEEAFTLCRDEAARGRFFDDLMDLSEAGATPVAVALRADFYGRCAEHPRLAAALAAHQLLLGSMQPDELRRAVEGPARAAGLRFEAGLIDTMLAEVEGEPGALPLLSHALYESWARREGRILTLEGYRAAGGVRGAIAHTADEVFKGCDEHERTLMRRMFLRLTELGETTEDSRRRVPLAELIPEGDGGEAATAVLEQLARSRLLVVGDDSAEIAHEALIREWPRLRGWLAEDREVLRTLRQLTTAARSWEESGRDEADLYRGPRLVAAAELAGDERQFSRVERDFLEASRDARDRDLQSARRRARRLRVLLAVVAAALVAAVIAGSFALVQRGNARETATVAQAGRLAAQSREVAAEHPDLGLLLALEAGRLDDSVDTRGALLGALEHASPIRAWLHGFPANVSGSAFSPDGKLLATVTYEGTTLWDTATWRPVGPPLRSSQGRWEGADFSPDGQTLAITGGEGLVELWGVASRKKLRDLRDPVEATSGNRALSVVRYSPDGSLIAAGGQSENHVIVWDAATGRIVGRPIITNPLGSGAQSIYFSPDSKRIAAPGAPGTVGIWEVATGRAVGKPLTVGSEDVEEAIFTRDGRTLIVSDDSGAVSMVDVATRRRIRPPFSVGEEPAAALDLSPDGRLLAVAAFAGSVFVWDIQTGEPYGSPLAADTSPVSDVEFSPDGRTLVSAHVETAVLWNMSGEQAIGKPLGGPRDLTSDVAFSSDGKRLVAGRFEGGAVVYDTATRRPVGPIDGRSLTTAVAFHPTRDLVAVATIDGKVGLFDPKTGDAVGSPLDAGAVPIWQVAFSPDGRLLAAAVDPNGAERFGAQLQQGEVQFWSVDSRRRMGEVIRPGAGTVFSIAFNREGTLLATGSFRGQLDLWDVATRARRGKPMRIIDDGVLSVAFDPSSRLVAGGGAIGPVRVWRVADQRPAFPPLAGHTGEVTGVAFDPAGSYLATTSLFGATRLWDSATGLGYGDELVGAPRSVSLISTLDLPPFLALGNEFSPDGRLLAVAGVESLAMLWDVDPAVWRQRACAIVGRNLSREEWALYLPAGTDYRATCPEWPAS
jgi:WD40 repeat protein/class 3 adenylate cyclase